MSRQLPMARGTGIRHPFLLSFALLLVLACRAATVSYVTLTSSANPIRKGQSATLSCTTFYSDGTHSSCVSPVYTDDQSQTVVRISGNTISGYSIGSATVKVTVSGVSATLAMKVIPPTQEALGVITATQVAKALGFNVDPANDWEFQMAAAAGATHVRFQCGWGTAEFKRHHLRIPSLRSVMRCSLTASPHTGHLANTSCILLWLRVTARRTIAILRVTAPGGAPAGATSIRVQLVPGQGVDKLSSLAPFSDTITRSDGMQISNAHSYPGALITAVKVSDTNHATLTLASALSSALPATTATLYTVNEYLYPPPATSSPSDSSVMRYAEYAEFLAQSLAHAGLKGEIELWNEPTWPDDRWDERANSYDLFPGPFHPGPRNAYLPNWGFVGALQGRATPAGVSYIWAGTEKSGSNSVLDPQMQLNSGVAFAEPAISVLSESFHPYGNSPEDALWIAPCWATTTGNNDFFNCNLFGLAGGNFSLAAQEDYFLKVGNPTYGVSHNITETGFGLANGDSRASGPVHHATVPRLPGCRRNADQLLSPLRYKPRPARASWTRHATPYRPTQQFPASCQTWRRSRILR